jgi:hypothetical protein
MKKRLLFIVFGSMVATTSCGQISNLLGANNNILRTTSPYEQVEGSPYLVKDWMPGQVQSRDGKMFGNVYLRYDTYKDEVEVEADGKTLIIDNKAYPQFEIDVRDADNGKLTKRVFRNGYNIPGYSVFQYFEVLFQSDVVIVLRKHFTTFSERENTNYGGNTTKVKSFTNKSAYFVIEGETVNKLSPNKKGMLRAVSNRAAMERVINKEKIREEDMARIFEAYVNEVEK